MPWMRWTCWCALLLVVGCDGGGDDGPDPDGGREAATAVVGDDSEPVVSFHQRIPGTRVRLAPPQGFELDPVYCRLDHDELRAAIVVSEMPNRLETTKRAFTDESLRSRDMTVQAREAVRIDGHTGELIEVIEPGDEDLMRVWIAVFGNETASVALYAMLPASQETGLSETLRKTLLNAKWNPGSSVDWFAGLGCDLMVDASAVLEVAARMGPTVVITPGGRFRSARVAAGQFTLAVGRKRMGVMDQEELARRELYQVQGVRIEEVLGVSAMPHQGMAGSKSIARGVDVVSGESVRVVQWVLTEQVDMFVMQGVAGDEQWGAMREEFERLAKSFRKRTAGTW